MNVRVIVKNRKNVTCAILANVIVSDAADKSVLFFKDSSFERAAN